MKLKSTNILFFFIIILSGCSKPTEPIQIPQASFTPLNIGDIKQYINVVDSSTLLVQVVDTLKRTDGLKVFQINWITGALSPRITFYAVRDGYFVNTLLDSVQNSTNPFNEQRIAKSNPANGDTWQDFAGDSVSSYVTAVFYQSKKTTMGTIPNVFGFLFHNKSALTTDSGLTPYYAENIGYIGTDYNNDGQLDLSLTYAKVGDKIYGALWPTKNPTPPFGEY